MYRLRIKVVPGASRNQIAGWLGKSLKIRVTPRPEKGKANTAVVALLARALRIPEKNVTISSGAASTQKTVEISGLSEPEIRSRLAEFEDRP